MRILDIRVAHEWVDYNGHMNDAEYARVFSLALEALMDHIGLDEAGRAEHSYTIYTLETHLCYRREAHLDQALSVNVMLLDRDAKRLHVFMEMLDADDRTLATSEQMLMGMGVENDSEGARPAPFPAPVAEHIEGLPHIAQDAWPKLAGRRIGLPPAKR
nr:thioesterase family protein [uncultured Halomonas sp.]